MGRKNVPVKTKEGTQEIRARSLGLAPRIRTALLLVDGIKSVAELENLMAAAGVTPGALQLLIDKGLIRFPEEEQAAEPAMPVNDAILPKSEPRVEAAIAPAHEPAAKAATLPPTSPEAAQAMPDVEAPTILEMSLQKTILQVREPEPVIEPEPEPPPEPVQIAAPKLVPQIRPALPSTPASGQPISELVAKPKPQLAPAPSMGGRPQVESLIELPKPRVPARNTATESKPPLQVADLMPPFPAPAPRKASAPLEVVTLLELETILGGATKMEVATILGVATMLELTPTQMMAPRTAVRTDPHEEPRLPPLAHAERAHRVALEAAPKLVLPAAVLRMNLMAARAHLAAALDQFLEIDGYVLKQKVMACEAREELEHLFGPVEAALVRKLKKPAISSLIATANNILDR